MATATYDDSVERMRQIAERDGIISHPDIVNLIRSTLDQGSISLEERRNLLELASRSNSYRAKKLIERFNDAIINNNLGSGNLQLPAFAANRVCDFLMKSDSGCFPGLDRDEVGIGMMMRLANPGLIDQSSASLCGPASMMYSLIKSDPMQYVNFAISLFEHGRARLGKLDIEPGTDCKNYRPAANSIPHIEWLTLASIRDSENWFFDYDSVGDQVAGMTTPRELAKWFKKAGFSDVQDDSETWRLITQAPARLIDKANDLHRRGYHVCMLINDQLMYSSKQGNGSIIAKHWVVLTSPIQRTPSIKFTVFSWAEGAYPIPHPSWNASAGSYSGPTKALTESNLREHLFGIVAAKP